MELTIFLITSVLIFLLIIAIIGRIDIRRARKRAEEETVDKYIIDTDEPTHPDEKMMQAALDERKK